MAQRYHIEGVRTVEGMTRDEVCRKFAGKVQMLARRVFERLSKDSGVQIEDLVSHGSIGLLEAFDRFDPNRAIQFSTFAEYRIRGAMYDALRENDVFSRRHRMLARKVQTATEALRNQLGDDPAPEDVAKQLGITLEDYWAVVDRTKPVVHISIDGPVDDDEGAGGAGRTFLDRWLSAPNASPDNALILEEVRQSLSDAIAALPDRHRECILMYYGKGLTLAEIAAVYEITVSRVSQILTEARERLRKKMNGLIDAHDAALEFPQ